MEHVSCEPDPRAQIRALRAAYVAERAADAIGRWNRRYVVWICDYLLGLDPAALHRWRASFAALHAMVASAWGERPRRLHGARAERLAWARLCAGGHLRFARLHASVPRGFDHARFVEHYQGFVRLVAARGAMSPIDRVRLVADYGRERRARRQ